GPGEFDREGGQVPALDEPASALVAMGGDAPRVGPAAGGVGAHAEQSCCLADGVGLHAGHPRAARTAVRPAPGDLWGRPHGAGQAVVMTWSAVRGRCGAMALPSGSSSPVSSKSTTPLH